MQQAPQRPGLFARLLAEPSSEATEAAEGPASAHPLVRTLDLALKTRPGGALGDPTFGIPSFADLVHGDRAAIHTLRSELRRLLSAGATASRGLEIRAHLDRDGAALDIEVFDRGHAGQQPIATARIDALGVPTVRSGERRRRG